MPGAHESAERMTGSALGSFGDRADDFPPVSYETWRARVEDELAGAPFERRLVTTLYEGIDLQPLYTDADWPHAEARSGRTGLSPMTRGATPLATARAGWDLRQERREPTPALVNALALEDLLNGVSSVLLRFDLACRCGLDPDAPEATGLVGVDGAALATLDDLDAALEGVHLNMITLALEAGAAFTPAASLVTALWDRRGLAPKDCRAAFNADPLAVLARDGRLPVPLDRALTLMADLAVRTDRTYAHATSVRVGSAPYHHAGATATQDLAFLIATGVEYLRAMQGAGLALDRAARQMLFSVALGSNQFLAIAKLRAARALWARIIEACGGDEDARRMTLHARTSKRVLTRRDPWVNMLRNTSCCFAAAVGGADVITSAPFDDPLGLPGPIGRRIARNTQTILGEEAHVHRVADPAGGSWYLESLTDELATRAWAMFQEIERLGGMASVLKSGWVAGQIESAFEPRARNIATRRDAVLGVSEFPIADESLLRPEAPDPVEVEREAIERVRRARSAAAVAPIPASAPDGQAAEAAHRAASGGASIGQLSAALGFGAGETIDAPVAPHPYAAPFEELRDAADAHEARCGERPSVFLATMGSLAEYTARAGFSANLFRAGGFRVIEPSSGLASAEDAARALQDSGAAIAVICSTDEKYETLVPAVAPRLREAGARSVVLAGRPGEKEGAYRDAGVDRFVYMRCDALSVLRDLLEEEHVL